MSSDEFEVVEVEAQPLQQFDSLERSNVDIQVATAKAHRRKIALVKSNIIALIADDREIAQSCMYALPRGGKLITGMTVHLAQILAQQYGNIRAGANIVEITDKQVVSRGVAWDLENNYAAAYEVRRSIVGKNGQRFNDDMITVTGNAANAIAYRNAVLAVIPKSLSNAAYRAAQGCITGDLSDEDKVIARRKKAVEFFNDEYAITEEEVLKLLGKQTINQIKAEEIALLIGFQQSLKDGDTTVDDLMRGVRTKADSAKAAKDLFEKNKTSKNE